MAGYAPDTVSKAVGKMQQRKTAVEIQDVTTHTEELKRVPYNYDRRPGHPGEAEGLSCLCSRHPAREKAGSSVKEVVPGGLGSLAGARFYMEDVISRKKLIIQT